MQKNRGLSSWISLSDLMTARDFRGKRVLIRADFNVPLADGRITSTARIDAALDTIRQCVAAGARVAVMSHIGRPREGEFDAAFSLSPVADYLAKQFDGAVKLYADYLRAPPPFAADEVAVLENVRFNVGEKENAAQLAKQYAALCDVFVMDAFGVAHRSHASTVGVAHYAPRACAGSLLQAELAAIGKTLRAPQRPLLAIVGGAKVSTKLTLLEALSAKVDQLIPGGGIANTFIKAAGHNIGQSLHEPELVEAARKLLAAGQGQGQGKGRAIPLPDDVVTAKACRDDVATQIVAVGEVADDDMILDIGPQTARRYGAMIEAAGTVLWNGPLGVFELPPFAAGTESISRTIATSSAYSLAGGGDTLAAIEKFGVAEKLSYISTGGGAFLEMLKGETLPAVAALQAGNSRRS